MTGPDDPSEFLEGVVTARRCGCCGHHEIGIVTAAGDFVALRPGMRVTIADAAGRAGDGADG